MQNAVSVRFLSRERLTATTCAGVSHGPPRRPHQGAVLLRALRRLDAFDVIILDDLGYVQQSAEEVEVLFTLMAERYRRRSLIITSNLLFGEWDQIFKSPTTAAAAIDRIVHHSVILVRRSSIRAEEAKLRSRKDQPQPSANS